VSKAPSLKTVMSRLVEEVAGLQRTVAVLVAGQPQVNEQGQSSDWVPLKATLRAGYSTETVRRWAEAGLVRAELRGGRRYIDQNDLKRVLALKHPGEAA
jgi:hypothetical protein